MVGLYMNVCVCVWYVCVYGMRIYVYDMICMYVWMDVCMACMYGWVYGWDIRRMQVCDAPADCAVGFLWHDFFFFFLFLFFFFFLLLYRMARQKLHGGSRGRGQRGQRGQKGERGAREGQRWGGRERREERETL